MNAHTQGAWPGSAQRGAHRDACERVAPHMIQAVKYVSFGPLQRRTSGCILQSASEWFFLMPRPRMPEKG